MESLDKIIAIVKSWPWVNCMPNKTMKDYLKVERFLVDDNYELIEKA